MVKGSRQGSYESEKMAYKNPTKPSSYPFDDKHLLDAHPSCLFGACIKEAASDTLVHRYTPVGVTSKPVRELDTTAWEVRSSPPELRLPTKPNSHDANTKDGKYNSGLVLVRYSIYRDTCESSIPIFSGIAILRYFWYRTPTVRYLRYFDT